MYGICEARKRIVLAVATILIHVVHELEHRIYQVQPLRWPWKSLVRASCLPRSCFDTIISQRQMPPLDRARRCRTPPACSFVTLNTLLYVAGLLGWLGFSQPKTEPAPRGRKGLLAPLIRSEYASDGDKGWFFSYGHNPTFVGKLTSR